MKMKNKPDIKLTDMNRLFTALCMVTILGVHTSCNDNVMEYETPCIETKATVADQRVQSLIQQAREGDADAYYALALCYRDGDGLERSWLNMICMYATYCRKTNEDLESILDLVEKEDPFRIIYKVLESPSTDKENMAMIEQLRQTVPAEAKAIEAAVKAFSVEDVAKAMDIVQEAEKEGSEAAVMFQAIYYNEVTDKTGQEEFLIRASEKYPFLYLELGDMYARSYRTSGDFADIQTAMEYYYTADAHGMLGPKHASTLLGMYDYHGEKGMFKCSKQEKERLQTLARRAY